MIPQFQVLMDESASPAVTRVLNSGYIGQGEKVDKFEHELKRVLKFRKGITVNSGTSALHLGLHLIGMGEDDVVISTPMTCSATNEAILMAGAKIVWADVDRYGNINTDSVFAAIKEHGKRVRAVMAVDWGGLPCDYEELRNICHRGNPKSKINIVEDAAHSYLATYKDQPICKTGGDYVAFSFQAIKHLTAGDGGLLVVPPMQYQRAKLLRWYGLDRTQSDAMRCKQDIREFGFKYHMNDINASIGLSNIFLSKVSVSRAQKNAAFFDKHFVDAGILPPWPQDRQSSFWLYTIHVKNPDSFQKFMAERGVAVSQVHNRNDKFSMFRKYRTKLPNLDKWFSTMVCIPVGWWLTEENLEYIKELVFEWVAAT